MIVQTVCGQEYNYTGSKHHIPLHTIRPNKVKKTSLKKPQLKRWWYLNYSRVEKWVKCTIVSEQIRHGVTEVEVRYFDEEWDTEFAELVFDKTRLKFAITP